MTITPRKNIRISADAHGLTGGRLVGESMIDRDVMVTATLHPFITASIDLNDTVRLSRKDQSSLRILSSTIGTDQQKKIYSDSSIYVTASRETMWNVWNSGSAPVEYTAVPASASAFYSKKVGYQTLTVKKTASFFDTVVPFSGVIVPSAFAAGTGSLITYVTGANTQILTSSFLNPATIRINVPQQGTIVDLRVWVEIIHLSGGPGKTFPLGNLGIAIRSPNLRWGHANPLLNDPAIVNIVQNNSAYFLGIDSNFGNWWYPPPNAYRDSFILWEGPGVFGVGDLKGPFNSLSDGGFTLKSLPCWQRDRSMRTIFSDGAKTLNPRHHRVIEKRSTYSGYVPPPPAGAFQTERWEYGQEASGTAWQGSPNATGIQSTNQNNFPAPDKITSVREVAVSSFGADWPWTSDKTIFPATESHQTNGSPPKGWLNGAGGVADVNEWPTTGVNYGAEEIKPMYPLMDSIYVRKVLTGEGPMIGFSGSENEVPVIAPDNWRGFRPGLRGTEMSGTWELLLHQQNIYDGPTQAISTYFRQVRLEFTYEVGRRTNVERGRRKNAPERQKSRLISKVSGAAGWLNTNIPTFGTATGTFECYTNEIWTDVSNDTKIGATFGIVAGTGTVELNDVALLVKLTGALGDISGSAPGWLLNNRWGMPVIPISSASLVVYEETSSFGNPLSALIDQTVGQQRLSAVSNDLKPQMTRAQIAAAFVTSSTT